MSIHEQFIPGTWIDTIDVNDFINLNKKPFLKEPTFLKKERNEKTKLLFQGTKTFFEQNEASIVLEYSSLENETCEWLVNEIPKHPYVKKVGYSENFQHIKEFYKISEEPSRKKGRKTPYQLVEEVMTSEIKKMLKMNLLSYTPTTYSPFFLHPDIRIIPLYGTKQLIKEKRWELKTLEKHLKNQDWMQRRMLLHAEIESIKNFEKFAKNHNVDVTKPAQSSQEVCLFLLTTIAGTMAENPSIAFTLAHVIPFLDVFIEQDIQAGLLNEEDAQALVDWFYIKLAHTQFTLSPGLSSQYEQEPVFLGDTFGGEYVTKTTYRFLHAVQTFQLFPFVVRIAWQEHLPTAFKEFCNTLLFEGIPISFFDLASLQKKNDFCLYPNGQIGIPGESILFDAGSCDIEKLFYLSLNGGKDLENKINLTPITQPIRNKTLEFEEVFTKFKEFLVYVVSSYVELMNIIIYINETNQSHPFRTALSNYLMQYHVQFSFHHMENLVLLLSSIQQQTYTVQKDKSGWIHRIEPQETVVNELIAAQVIELIESEIRKIPIYKNGTSSVRLHHNNVLHVHHPQELQHKFVLPKEVTNVVFQANVVFPAPQHSLDWVRYYFKKGFFEISASFEKSDKIINSVYYKKENS